MTAPMAFVSAVPVLSLRASTSSFASCVRPVAASTARRSPARFVFALADTPANEADIPDAPAAPAVPIAPVAASAAMAENAAAPASATGNLATSAVSEDAGEAPAGDNKRRAGGRRSPGGGRPKREITLKLEDITVGMEIEGVVKSCTAYGAFVGDMGTPTDGLLHVSQLAAGYVENVTDVVNVGDKVTVRVLSVDLEKGNFSLTMKPPKSAEEEAADAERRASGGSRGGGGARAGGGGSSGGAIDQKWSSFTFNPEVFVDAKVVSVASFGAFCKILDAEGNEDASAPTDGLVHISEISEDRVEDVASSLSVGQVVKARVTAIDRKRNRISLSLKAHKADESSNLAEDMASNTGKQPTFKTSMAMAFERATPKPKAQ
jgi:predicted RNA-binding protein with RPS1 domain